MKYRLDHILVTQGLVPTRSQAENWIRLGKVMVAGRIVTKPGHFMADSDTIALQTSEQYVSRAGLKLASVAKLLNLDFAGKVVLDVGSSTGGFTDYALQHGAQKVIAVDVGTAQLHPSLRSNKKVELHEKTDIRDIRQLSVSPDIVVIDVSFISLRDVLPHIASLCSREALIVAMFKPQFEAGEASKHKGVIKNDRLRRELLHNFEWWAKKHFAVIAKADSQVAGAKGNRERFYLLKTSR